MVHPGAKLIGAAAALTLAALLTVGGAEAGGARLTIDAGTGPTVQPKTTPGKLIGLGRDAPRDIRSREKRFGKKRRGRRHAPVIAVIRRAPPPAPQPVVTVPPGQIFDNTPRERQLAEPDPAGPRFLPARHAEPRIALGEGDILTADRPLVLLDWRSYDLPPPRIGSYYVRGNGQVLLIDGASQRIIREIGD